MTDTHHLGITHSENMSPAEFANAALDALRAAGLDVQRVTHSDLDTILWTFEQEKIEGIERDGSGYGAPRHLSILKRAGYGG